MVTFARCLLCRIGAICLLSFVLAELVAADDVLKLSAIRSAVADVERQFKACEAEILIISLDNNNEPTKAAARNVIVTTDGFREHELTRFADASTPSMDALIRTWNRSTYTKIIPKRSVERHVGRQPESPTSLPYGPILMSLGYQGSLSGFLSESAAVHDVRIRTVKLEYGLLKWFSKDDEENIVVVARNENIPGSVVEQSTHLVFDFANGFRLLGGRLAEFNRESDDIQVQKKVRVSEWSEADTSFRYSIVALHRARVTHPDAPASTVVRVTGDRRQRQYEADVFYPTQFSGNPRIKQFDGGKLSQESDYHPPPETPVESSSPFLKWVIVNDILLAALLLVVFLRFVVRRLFKRSSFCVQ